MREFEKNELLTIASKLATGSVSVEVGDYQLVLKSLNRVKNTVDYQLYAINEETETITHFTSPNDIGELVEACEALNTVRFVDYDVTMKTKSGLHEIFVRLKIGSERREKSDDDEGNELP